MTLWIDGDACPRTIKDIVFRAALRTKTHIVVVSNHPLNTPQSPLIHKVQVGAGFDVVDNYIVAHIKAHDLVITADIPFADAIITKGGVALNPRGTLYNANNIKPYLASRNVNESLRGAGLLSSGPGQYTPKDIQQFANQLDRWLAQQK